MPDEPSYASLDDLKTRMGIDVDDYDDELTDALLTAEERIDGFTNSRFVPTTVTESYSGDGGRRFQLRGLPVLEVTSVTLDGSTVDSDSYVVDDAGYVAFPEDQEGRVDIRLRSVGARWTPGTNNIVVVYSYGYEAVPVSVKTATLKLARYYYEHDDAKPIISEQLGPRSVVYGSEMTGDPSLPAPIAGLLRRYKQYSASG